jgi:hypothetical protein
MSAVRAESKDALDLGVPILSSGCEVELQTVLIVFASVTGMNHMPSGAASSRPMLTSHSPSDNILHPSA